MNENKSYKNMELKFNKNGDAWVAEFEATDKFNLHMEGLLLGSFSILQRTAGGKYTHVRDIPTYPRFDKVFDYDFDALVYPKFIKIVSETEPTYAEVVSDGEITEIKSQTKEVEVTANGTTQVAPDAGYSYLTGVSIKTNVPQSGGSGGGDAPSGGGEAKYYAIDTTIADEGWQQLLTKLSLDDASANYFIAATTKMEIYGGGFAIMAMPILRSNYSDIVAFSFLPVSFSTSPIPPTLEGVLEAVVTYGGPSVSMNGITEITEEEFYNLGGE